MEKLEIFLLEETMGVVPEYWGLNQFANFNYSNVMKSLYLYDFPNAWKEGELKKKICTIGANDYFNKWTSEEFLVIEDSGLNGIFSLANEELVKGSIVNGKRTGIPLFGGNHQLLFYNKKLVNQVPEPMQDLIAIAESVKKKKKLDYGFVFPTGACYFILPFLYGYGANLWSNSQIPISEDSLYKTICFLRELIYERKVAPIKWEQAESIECFTKGNAAYCIGGDWNIKEFDMATDSNLGICKIPKLERECRSTANASYLFVSKYIKEELHKNIREFCKLFLGQDIQASIIRNLYRMPAARNFSIDKNNFDEKLLKSYEVYKRAFIMPPKKEVTHMYHVLADLLEPNVLIRDNPEELTKKVILHLNDVESYYKNNLLKM